MQEVDSGILEQVTKTLRLGSRGAQHTDFQDEILQQSFDVTPAMRRAGVLAPFSDGLTIFSVTNTHAGTNVVSSTFDPYNLAAPLQGFPSPVPEEFDLWLAWVCADNPSGVNGELARAGLFWNNSAELAVQTAGVVPSTLVLYGGEVTGLTTTVPLQPQTAATGLGAISVNAVPWRIPRSGSLLWQSASNGAGNPEFRLVMGVGVFPRNLGQDLRGQGG